jgi:hypothetical protein
VTPWWILQPVRISGFLQSSHLEAVADQDLADLSAAVYHIGQQIKIETERRLYEKKS